MGRIHGFRHHGASPVGQTFQKSNQSLFVPARAAKLPLLSDVRDRQNGCGEFAGNFPSTKVRSYQAALINNFRMQSLALFQPIHCSQSLTRVANVQKPRCAQFKSVRAISCTRHRSQLQGHRSSVCRRSVNQTAIVSGKVILSLC